MKRKIVTLIVCALAAAVCAVFAFACNKSETVDGLILKADGGGYQICGTTDGKLTVAEIPAEYKGKPITSIGAHAFDSNTALTAVYIPDSVISVGDSAFYCCRSLTEVTLPKGLTAVGEWAFGGCQSLANMYVPASVTHIGDYAFCYCTALTKLTYGGTAAQWSEISKGKKWNYGTGEFTVQCSDGVL